MQARAGYREALVALGGLPPLVALLDAPEKPVTLHVAQALSYIATTSSCRTAVRCVHGDALPNPQPCSCAW